MKLRFGLLATLAVGARDSLHWQPTRLIGDMAYGAAELLGWMVNDKAIEPPGPAFAVT